MSKRKTARPPKVAQRQAKTTSTKPARPAAPQTSSQIQEKDDGSRFSRTTWLAGILRERILSGAYKQGERIREVQLRSEFGFSNGPIREALQTIVADGLAERAPWHGVRIKVLDERQLIELFQVRLALLEYAAELAARRTSPQLVESAANLKQELDAVFNKIEQAEGHPSFNGRLSQWLLSSADNTALQAVWDKTMLQTLIYVNASLRRSQGRKSRTLINQLIDAICAGNVPAARSSARELTRQTLVDLGIKGTI
jgi:DNA-binding GntR family transcriptional regulator